MTVPPTIPDSIHFVGIGGSGVEPLARWCAAKGVEVTGSERSEERARGLRDTGLACRPGHRARHLPADAGLVVHSTAVPESNPELLEARSRGLPVMDRPAFLARLFHTSGRGVAITGTHGKTTTTALVSWMLDAAGRRPDAIVGGSVIGWDGGHRAGSGEVFVAEADESNLGYQNLNPETLVVNNLDYDHVDTYASFHDLEEKTLAYMAARDETTTFVVCQDEGQRTRRLLEAGLRPGSMLTTSLCRPGTLGDGLRAVRAHLEGEIVESGRRGILMRALFYGIPLGEFHLPMHGEHNARNALSAIGVGLRLGLDAEEMAHGLSGYPGVRRRMEWLGGTAFGHAFTDYAHHPTAVRAVLQGLRLKYPDRPMTVVFEPHRYSRLEVHWEAFGDALKAEGVREVLVLPVYSAGEEPVDGVDSRLVVRACSRARAVPAEAVEEMLPDSPDGVVAFLGAGPVDGLARRLAEVHALA